jgi:hypothetical protein
LTGSQVSIVQGLPSSSEMDCPGTHAPERQMSLVVHRSFALQGVLSGAGEPAHVPVAGLQVPATWHAPAAVQVTGLPAEHTPAWHESPCVQRLPSLQGVPSGAAGLEHVPVVGSQAPATWHWSGGAQVTGFEPVHDPLAQANDWKHALFPVHAVPSGAVGLEHWPVAGLQVPAWWHGSLAVHVTWLPAVQTPDWHVSFRSQPFPSLQAVPFAATGFEH